jgi:hypothetical protein
MASDEIILREISSKLSALIAIGLRQLNGDAEFANTSKRKQGVGDTARYLAEFGLGAPDIALIVGAPVQSIRTQLTPSAKKGAQ